MFPNNNPFPNSGNHQLSSDKNGCCSGNFTKDFTADTFHVPDGLKAKAVIFFFFVNASKYVFFGFSIEWRTAILFVVHIISLSASGWFHFQNHGANPASFCVISNFWHLHQNILVGANSNSILLPLQSSRDGHDSVELTASGVRQIMFLITPFPFESQ
jgi:hypothetical protein